MAIISAKGDFPYILKFRPRVIACKMKSFDNWETYDPILERGKIGLQHISKWTKSIFFGWTPPYTLNMPWSNLGYIWITILTYHEKNEEFCLCLKFSVTAGRKLKEFAESQEYSGAPIY